MEESNFHSSGLEAGRGDVKALMGVVLNKHKQAHGHRIRTHNLRTHEHALIVAQTLLFLEGYCC